ncbi:hypothetical protein M9458_048574, partial [Cirrhinus mrigala]
RQRSTTSPASQRHTRTPKPYLYVGVMEREKGSIRDGEEIIGGGKAPPPIQTRAHRQPGTAHQTPQQRKNYPHPIIQSTPRLQKEIDTQVKSMVTTSLPAKEATGSTNASKAPAPGPSPSACTNPRSRRHTKQDPSPPGPAGIPARWQSGPRTPSPPPGPTSAGTGLPNSAACSRQKNNTQEPPTPHPGQDRSPSAEPPKKPTPRELPDAPSPYGPPTATTKTKAGQNRDPHSH